MVNKDKKDIKEEKKEEETKIVSVSSVECEYLKKTLLYQEKEVVYINIKYPQIKLEEQNKTAEQKINSFYEKTAKNFMIYAENKLYRSAVNKYMLYERSEKTISENGNYESDEEEIYKTAKFKPFGATLNFCVTYNKESKLSIYLESVVYTGQGRGKVERLPQCWQFSETDCIYIYPHNILKLGKKEQMNICETITAQIESKIQKNEEYFIYSDYDTVKRFFNPKNFYLHEKGYAFYYPQGTLTPPDSGIIEFVIKR